MGSKGPNDRVGWTSEAAARELEWDGSPNERYGWIAVGDMALTAGQSAGLLLGFWAVFRACTLGDERGAGRSTRGRTISQRYHVGGAGDAALSNGCSSLVLRLTDHAVFGAVVAHHARSQLVGAKLASLTDARAFGRGAGGGGATAVAAGLAGSDQQSQAHESRGRDHVRWRDHRSSTAASATRPTPCHARRFPPLRALRANSTHRDVSPRSSNGVSPRLSRAHGEACPLLVPYDR